MKSVPMHGFGYLLNHTYGPTQSNDLQTIDDSRDMRRIVGLCCEQRSRVHRGILERILDDGRIANDNLYDGSDLLLSRWGSVVKTDEKNLEKLGQELDAYFSELLGDTMIDGDPVDADYWFRRPHDAQKETPEKAVP